MIECHMLYDHCSPGARGSWWNQDGGICGDLSLIPEGEHFQTFSPQSASVRRVPKECIARCVQSGRTSSAEVLHTPMAKSKLSMVEVKAFRAEFCQSYPGELLTPTTMPSLSFLSILKEAIGGNSFAWVPWKGRISEADEEAFLEHRRPRNERQLLRSLLSEGDAVLQDQPEAFINHQLSAEVVVTRFQCLLTTALAMLGQAHLIRRFHTKFLEIAVQTPWPTPSLTISHGDFGCGSCGMDSSRRALGGLNMVTQWRAEWVAFCWQVFHSSLAPRPKPLQVHALTNRNESQTFRSPFPRSRSRIPRLKGDGKPSQPLAKKPKSNESWVKKLNNGKGVCIRFHLGKRKSGQNCRYAHQCPVLKSNRDACGGFHIASKYKEAPHWPSPSAEVPVQQDLPVDVACNLQEQSIDGSQMSLTSVSAQSQVKSPKAQQFSSQCTARFFLDVFARATMPVSTAVSACLVTA